MSSKLVLVKDTIGVVKKIVWEEVPKADFMQQEGRQVVLVNKLPKGIVVDFSDAGFCLPEDDEDSNEEDGEKTGLEKGHWCLQAFVAKTFDHFEGGARYSVKRTQFPFLPAEMGTVYFSQGKTFPKLFYSPLPDGLFLSKQVKAQHEARDNKESVTLDWKKMYVGLSRLSGKLNEDLYHGFMPGHVNKTDMTTSPDYKVDKKRMCLRDALQYGPPDALALELVRLNERAAETDKKYKTIAKNLVQKYGEKYADNPKMQDFFRALGWLQDFNFPASRSHVVPERWKNDNGVVGRVQRETRSNDAKPRGSYGKIHQHVRTQQRKRDHEEMSRSWSQFFVCSDFSLDSSWHEGSTFVISKLDQVMTSLERSVHVRRRPQEVERLNTKEMFWKTFHSDSSSVRILYVCPPTVENDAALVEWYKCIVSHVIKSNDDEGETTKVLWLKMQSSARATLKALHSVMHGCERVSGMRFCICGEGPEIQVLHTAIGSQTVPLEKQYSAVQKKDTKRAKLSEPTATKTAQKSFANVPDLPSGQWDDISRNCFTCSENQKYQFESTDILGVGNEMTRNWNNVIFVGALVWDGKASTRSDLETSDGQTSFNLLYDAVVLLLHPSAQKDKVVGAFNQGTNHWVAFCVLKTNTDALHLLIKDSFSTYHPSMIQQLLTACLWEANLHHLASSLIVHSGKLLLDAQQNVVTDQKDQVSCGVFALWNMRVLAHVPVTMLKNSKILPSTLDFVSMEKLPRLRILMSLLFFANTRGDVQQQADETEGRDATRVNVVNHATGEMNAWEKSVRSVVPSWREGNWPIQGVQVAEICIDPEVTQYWYSIRIHLDIVLDSSAQQGFKDLSDCEFVAKENDYQWVLSEKKQLGDALRVTQVGEFSLETLWRGLEVQEQNAFFQKVLCVAEPARTSSYQDSSGATLMPRVFRCVCLIGLETCQHLRDMVCSVPDNVVNQLEGAVQDLEKSTASCHQLRQLKEAVSDFCIAMSTIAEGGGEELEALRQVIATQRVQQTSRKTVVTQNIPTSVPQKNTTNQKEKKGKKRSASQQTDAKKIRRTSEAPLAQQSRSPFVHSETANCLSQSSNGEYQYQSCDIVGIGTEMTRTWNDTVFVGALASRRANVVSGTTDYDKSYNLLRDGLVFLGKHHRKRKEKLVGVFNEGRNHWVAFCVVRTDTKLFALLCDSFGNKCAGIKEMISSCRSLIKGIDLPPLTFWENTVQYQNDSVSCGVFALWNMRRLALVDASLFLATNIEKIMSSVKFTKTIHISNLRIVMARLFFAHKFEESQTELNLIATRQATWDNLHRHCVKDLTSWRTPVQELLPNWTEANGVKYEDTLRLDDDFTYYRFSMCVVDSRKDLIFAENSPIHQRLKELGNCERLVKDKYLWVLSEKMKFDKKLIVTAVETVTLDNLAYALFVTQDKEEFKSVVDLAYSPPTSPRCSASLLPRVFRCVCLSEVETCVAVKNLVCKVPDNLFDSLQDSVKELETSTRDRSANLRDCVNAFCDSVRHFV